MKLIRTAILSLALAFGAGAVVAQDYQKGLTAAKAGDFSTALREWQPLAEQGVADAQRNLGALYFFGKGVLQDYAEAAKWLRLAAEQGNVDSQGFLGDMYKNGQGVLKDNEEAVKWYTLAAEQGNARAKSLLRDLLYSMGKETFSQDEEGYGCSAANELFKKAKELGQTEAFKYIKFCETYALAVGGNADAQLNLGEHLIYSDLIFQDNEEAVNWYTLAAEQGNPQAQTNLGLMYEKGQGVLKDNEEAVKWYTLAAEQGNARAKSLLRDLLYSMGKETFSQDEEGYGCSAANELFKKAKELGETEASKYIKFCETYALAVGGNADAQLNLGAYLLGGFVISQDSKEAVKWFQSSAAQGNAKAQKSLGLMYARGNGVSKNEKAALNWYLAAAKQGDEAAGELASELLVKDIVYGSTVDKLHNLAASISGCFSIGDAKCAFDKIWEYLDISKDGNLSIAEISKFQRNLVKFAYVEKMQDEVEIEEVAAINLTTILLLPITSTSILHSFDYNNDGTLQKEEVFGETEFAKLVGIDAQSLLNGVEFQTLGNKLNNAMRSLPLPF
jgi:uncharacterized protein